MKENTKKEIDGANNKIYDNPENKHETKILTDAVEEIKEKVIEEFWRDTPHETNSNLTLYHIREKLEKELRRVNVNYEDIQHLLLRLMDDCYNDCIQKMYHALGKFGASLLVKEFKDENISMIENIANQRLADLLSKEKKEMNHAKENAEMPSPETIAKIKAVLNNASNEAETIMFA